MQITLNGAEKTVPDRSSALTALNHLSIPQDRIIFLLNDRVVQKEHYESQMLSEQDRIEILRMVGGG